MVALAGPEFDQVPMANVRGARRDETLKLVRGAPAAVAGIAGRRLVRPGRLDTLDQVVFTKGFRWSATYDSSSSLHRR